MSTTQTRLEAIQAKLSALAGFDVKTPVLTSDLAMFVVWTQTKEAKRQIVKAFKGEALIRTGRSSKDGALLTLSFPKTVA